MSRTEIFDTIDRLRAESRPFCTATVVRSSSSSARSTDSAPAIDPKSGSTRSDSRSPSRFRHGITSGGRGTRKAGWLITTTASIKAASV